MLLLEMLLVPNKVHPNLSRSSRYFLHHLWKIKWNQPNQKCRAFVFKANFRIYYQ